MGVELKELGSRLGVKVLLSAEALPLLGVCLT